MALGGKVVYLVGLHLLDDADQTGGVCQVPVVKNEVTVGLVRILVQVIDAVGIEQGSAPFDAVDNLAFIYEQFREVGPVLSGDAGY
jgi:hypothetical protein